MIGRLSVDEHSCVFGFPGASDDGGDDDADGIAEVGKVIVATSAERAFDSDRYEASEWTMRHMSEARMTVDALGKEAA